MAYNTLVPRRLLPDSLFNWVYVVELVVALILTVFFLFYFNRLFGSLLAYALRKYTWHKYRVYIDVKALQISPLAGRIFFKGFRYHGHNETILINDGYITWRYWLRRVREVEFISAYQKKQGHEHGAYTSSVIGENGGKNSLNELPCRIKAKVRGVEWFIYNRSPAYDSILQSISSEQAPDEVPVRKRTRLNKSNPPADDPNHHHVGSHSESSWSSSDKNDKTETPETKQALNASPTMTTKHSSTQSGYTSNGRTNELPLMLQILPIKIECSKGAIVMGNQHTRSVMTAKFDSAIGRVDAQSPSSTLDTYKQLFDLDFTHPVIQFKGNKSFLDSQHPKTTKKSSAMQNTGTASNADTSKHTHNQEQNFWFALRDRLPRLRGSDTSLSQERVKHTKTYETNEAVPGEHRWLGLMRYMDDEDDLAEQERWKAVEYGRFETIVDSPGLALSIHWDVPGQVLKEPVAVGDFEVEADINGDSPPDWSIDLRIRGGEIHYGPWADRQRTDLQNAFFPTLYKDAIPAPRIPLGAPRVATVFKLMVEVESTTKLVLHTREESKDWRWRGQTTIGQGSHTKSNGKRLRTRKKGEKTNLNTEVRPYGWLDLQVSPDSTVNYTMDLFAKPNGYRNRLELDLRGLEMASSVNHELFWRSRSQSISCDLSNPIEWNSLRQWCINVKSDALEVFLLRDHIFLLTDLINDWSSGPPGNYYTFVPFKYLLNLQLTNFRLYLNANDSNIINNPSDVDDNTFVVVWGEHLNSTVTIPLHHYQPSRNTINFDVDAQEGGFELRTPQWNTQHTFLKDSGVASLDVLKIRGSYDYATSTSSALTDILTMQVHGVSPKIQLYGFLVRYLMKIKDNYFGEDLHFRTLEEYKNPGAVSREHKETVDATQHSKVSNDLDVILNITADNNCVVLPSGLYTAAEGVSLEIASVRGDLRFTNYYMDLTVIFSPISMSHVQSIKSQDLLDTDSKTQIFIEGLNLYGHRLFGLPPTEPTYVCNWDFDVGAITGECSPGFLRGLLLGVRCFGFSFSDEENALPPLNSPIIHDATFLRLKVRPILVWLCTESAAFQLSTQGLILHFNDWAGTEFSQRLRLKIPDFILAIVDNSSTSSDRRRDHSVKVTQAYLQTDVDVRMLTKKQDLVHLRGLQQDHIRWQDVRTHRTPWLIHAFDPETLHTPVGHIGKVKAPAMQFPQMPEPVEHNRSPSPDLYSISSSSTQSGGSMTASSPSSRQSSFLANKARRVGSTASFARYPISYPEKHFFQHTPRSATPGSVSGIPSSGSDRGQPAFMGFASPSPYRTPHFPTQDLVIDLQDVPALAEQAQRPGPTSCPENGPLKVEPSNHHAAKSSLIFNSGPIVRAFCTPVAFNHVVNLLTDIEAESINTCFDDLQLNTMDQNANPDDTSQKRSANTTELCIRIPDLRLKIQSVANPRSQSFTDYSSLCIDLDRLAVTAGLSKTISTDKAQNPRNQSSFHTSLDRFYLAFMMDPSNSRHSTPPVCCTILNLTFWSNIEKSLSTGIIFKDIDVVVASKGLDESLSSAMKTMKSVDSVLRKYSQRVERQKLRLQLLVLAIVLAGEEIPDPPFLTRASYVLRSANNHLRNSDSWKLMARLRHILDSLPAELQAEIVEQCIINPAAHSKDARDRVAASLEQWRAWDGTQIKHSRLMQKVYGTIRNISHEQPDPTTAVKASLRGEGLRLAIVVGHGLNNILVEQLEIAVLHNQPAVISGGFVDPDTFSTGDSVLQAHCTKITTSVDWDLWGLIEVILRIPSSMLQSKPQTTSMAINPTTKRRIHLIISSDTSISTLMSSNLKMTLFHQRLNASALLSGTASRRVISFLINVDATMSEIQSHSRQLIVSNLGQLNVCCATDHDIETAKSSWIWKVGVSCNTLKFGMLEDPFLFMEVLDLVLRDEISYAVKLMGDISKRMPQTLEKAPSQDESVLTRARITLCIDSYSVSLRVLPSLSYSILGGAVRTAIQHGIRKPLKTVIDIDISDHVHAIRNPNEKTSAHIAAVQIPPFNGQLSLDLSHLKRSIGLSGIVEEIKLDASTLHTLLMTISRPEIRHLAKSIAREVQSMQTQYQPLFMQSDHHPKKAPSDNPIIYDAYVNVAGLTIHASSPLSSTTAREGQLDFRLGCLQAKASNKHPEALSAHQFPEVDICLNSIQAILERIEDTDRIPSGEVAVAASLRCTSKDSPSGELIPEYQVRSSKFEISMYPKTVPIIIDILGHLQETLKTIDLTSELKSLRSIRRPKPQSKVMEPLPEDITKMSPKQDTSTALFGAIYSLELTNIRLKWIIGSSIPTSPGRETEDLVLSFSKIDLSTKRENAARLLIEDFQLQLVAASKVTSGRSQNSALLPQVVFNVAYLSTRNDRRLAFQAAGKSLDLRLNSKFILPASDLRRSIAFALQEIRNATADWKASATERGSQSKQLLNAKKFASVLVDADFAGAVVYIEGGSVSDRQIMPLNMVDGGRAPQHGRYNQFTPDNASSSTTLRSPGLAFKVEYRNRGADQESLNAEIKVDASENILHPTIVPLIMDISSSVKETVGESATPEHSPDTKQASPDGIDDNRLRSADPNAIFGKCRVNLGLRICKQEFSLSCQPIARVAATARFEEIYVTVNTIQSRDHGQFFTVSAVFTKPQASVQHAYSREPTGSLHVESVVISLMSSKHVSAANGLSVILKISPLKIQVNARQLQDVLLFRDIWVPQEIRTSSARSASSPSSEPQAFVVQRYQQVAAAGAFPWNATVSIAQLDVQLDLGQSLGRSAFNITNLWVSSKKTSNWEQNLCLGFDEAGVDATGRMSGLIELRNLRIRTSIQWPMKDANYQTPLVQASLSFDHLRIKIAFDYQVFLILSITTVDFLMYNVRHNIRAAGDRLVAVANGNKVQVFCTAISASQGLALYQAIQRLIQEKHAAYQAALKDIEHLIRRKSSITQPVSRPPIDDSPLLGRQEGFKVPIRLQTNVVVNLKAVNTGVFPGTFFDNQILKLEAKDASARFSVALEEEKIHSTLGMTLGQLRVALSGVARPSTPKKVGEVVIEEIITSATASRGGLILGVPRTVVNMQIWQRPESNHIDYIFKSSFEGNIDVGWNYSRISFIRGMHSSHVRALAQRLGKPLPQSAVQITGGRRQDGNDDDDELSGGEHEKITAVVNVPQSKYDYTALQPALVDTPQLRNLGEATPPLEWIGLHRERLPNLTHQIIIVSLLEVAKEVEDAYTKILGSS